MKKIINILIITLLLSSILPASVLGENNNQRNLSPKDMDILQSLAITDSFRINLNQKVINETIQNDIKTLEKSNLDKDKKQKLNIYKNMKNQPFTIQIFEGNNDLELLRTTLINTKEIDNLNIKIPKEVINQHVNEPFYNIPIRIIISTLNSVAVFGYDQFIINDINQISLDQKFAIVDYVKYNNLDKKVTPNFGKKIKPNLNLADINGDISTTCIACVGDIYVVINTTYEDKWTNVAQVHAIKGVDTRFTLSNSNSSSSSIGIKTVYEGGTVSSSGSSEINYTEVTGFPTITGTSIYTYGRYAQTMIRYKKTEYQNQKSPYDKFTTISANQVIGGMNWGAYVGGNGMDFDTVIGKEFYPDGYIEIEQTSSRTYTNAASVSVYGVTIGLSNTMYSSTGNKWRFDGKSGYGYTKYKVYNFPTINNLTAK